ncbi:MAG TPA: hypothetical protein VF199_04870 [Bacillales bacterium]
MEPIKWDLMEKLRSQQKNRQEQFEERRKRFEEAQERLRNATNQHEQIWFRQARGENVGEEGKQAETELNEARDAYQSALTDLQSPVEAEEEITPDALAKDWNENVLPRIKEEHIKPITDKMKEARYHYLKALHDYSSTVNAYNEDYNQASNLVFTQAMQRGQPPVNLEPPNNWNEVPMIRQEHVNSIIYGRQLPDEITGESASEE